MNRTVAIQIGSFNGKEPKNRPYLRILINKKCFYFKFIKLRNADNWQPWQSMTCNKYFKIVILWCIFNYLFKLKLGYVLSEMGIEHIFCHWKVAQLCPTEITVNHGSWNRYTVNSAYNELLGTMRKMSLYPEFLITV